MPNPANKSQLMCDGLATNILITESCVSKDTISIKALCPAPDPWWIESKEMSFIYGTMSYEFVVTGMEVKKRVGAPDYFDIHIRGMNSKKYKAINSFPAKPIIKTTAKNHSKSNLHAQKIAEKKAELKKAKAEAEEKAKREKSRLAKIDRWDLL